MARLVWILARRQGAFPEQGNRRKHRAGSRHGFAKVVSSSDWRDLPVKASRAIGRSVVRKFLILIEAGRIVVELPTGHRVERIGRIPASSNVSYFPADFCLRRPSYATR
jgi:hypothetical protein